MPWSSCAYYCNNYLQTLTCSSSSPITFTNISNDSNYIHQPTYSSLLWVHIHLLSHIFNNLPIFFLLQLHLTSHILNIPPVLLSLRLYLSSHIFNNLTVLLITFNNWPVFWSYPVTFNNPPVLPPFQLYSTAHFPSFLSNYTYFHTFLIR